MLWNLRELQKKCFCETYYLDPDGELALRCRRPQEVSLKILSECKLLGVLKGSLKATWKLRVAKSGNPSNLTWLIPAKGKQEEVKRESKSGGYLGSLIFA